MSLILGSITFQDFEVPSVIRFGGAQRLATHYLGSGSRIVDSLGPTESDIEFSGVLSGTDAVSRYLHLDRLRKSALVVPLIWDIYHYTVVIKELIGEFVSPRWISYRVACTVVPDEDVDAETATGSIVPEVIADVKAAAAFRVSSQSELQRIVRDLSRAGRQPSGARSVHDDLVRIGREIEALLAFAELERNRPGGGGDPSTGAVQDFLSLQEILQSMASLSVARGYVRRAAMRLPATEE